MIRRHVPPDHTLFGRAPWLRSAVIRWCRQRNCDNYSEESYCGPRFNTVGELKSFIETLLKNGDVIHGDSAYITLSYENKRIIIGCRLNNFLNQLHSVFLPAHLRLDYANVISVAATVTELWNFVDYALNCESGGERQYVPKRFIDECANALELLERCRQYVSVDMVDLTKVMHLRNEAENALKTYFRRFAFVERNLVPAHTPKENIEKYIPYDYEWLCANVVSGPRHAACLKYLASSRISQVQMTESRASILAVMNGFVLPYTGHINVPVSNRGDNLKSLINTLNDQESEMNFDYKRNFLFLNHESPNNRNVRYCSRTHEYFWVRAELRRKKRNVMEVVHRAYSWNITNVHKLIAILAGVEATLLLLHKVYGIVTDKKYGMYAKLMPSQMYAVANELYVSTNTTIFDDPEQFERLTNNLSKLKRGVFWHIRNFYRKYESICERNYSGPMEADPKCYNPAFEFNESDFPEELQGHAKTMHRYLRLEQTELFRLEEQLSQTRRAYFNWCRDFDKTPFMINCCPRYVSCFYNNFASVMPLEEITRAKVETFSNKDRMAVYYRIYTEVSKLSRNVMIEDKCTPTVADFEVALTVEFNKTLGVNFIGCKNAKEMAKQLLDVITFVSHSKQMKSRDDIVNVRGQSGIVSKKIAQIVVKAIMLFFADRETVNAEIVDFLKNVQGLAPAPPLKVLRYDNLTQKPIVFDQTF